MLTVNMNADMLYQYAVQSGSAFCSKHREFFCIVLYSTLLQLPPLRSTVPEDVGIDPTGLLRLWHFGNRRSNHSNIDLNHVLFLCQLFPIQKYNAL
jgi:hypothetical protein